MEKKTKDRIKEQLKIARQNMKISKKEIDPFYLLKQQVAELERRVITLERLQRNGGSYD